MQKYIKYLLMIFIVMFSAFTFNSCAKKYGCPGEDASIKMDKDGNLPTRKGKSELFDPQMRKRVKSGK